MAEVAHIGLDAGKQCAFSARHLDMMCVRGPACNLSQQVYGFCDATGEFHSFEGPDGKRLVMAFQALEEKILGKVERSLAEIRQDMDRTHTKSGIQDIAEQQKDLRMKVDEIGMEAFESRSDLITQIDEISQEASAVRADCMRSLEELELKLDSASSVARDLTLLEVQLEQDVAAQLELDFSAQLQQDDLECLQAEVRALGPHPHAGPDEPGRRQTACDIDLCEQPAGTQPSQLLGLGGTDFSSNFEGALARAPYRASFAEVPYSRKVVLDAPPCAAFSAKPAPFAHGFNIHRPRAPVRLNASRSAPFLAPLF